MTTIIQRNLSRRTLALPLLCIVLLAAAWPTGHAAERRSQAAAQYPKVKYEGFKLQRKDFRFFGFSAWLKRGGEWHIEGPVRHNGLLCGTYEVGMRFGIGKPDCTNVEWITDTRYATSQYQCNNAEMIHTGTEIDESMSGRFDEISCAERVINCSGNCK